MITPNKKPPEIQTRTLRLDDFSMGLNTTISGSLLNNNELQVAEDVSFEQKGTIMPRRGRRKRYEEAFSDSPCCGLGSYYKKDGTTKLLFAAGDKLYSDSPSISIKWDNQSDWEETDSKRVNLDSSTTPGDIQIKESTQIAPTFTRDSVAYLEDGTEVEANKPRFEPGKFGKGVLVEEGTTNLISNPTFRDGITGWLRNYNPNASYTILSEGNITYHQCKFINDSSLSAYIFRDITGLSPNTTYTLSFRGRWVFTQAVSNGVYVDLCVVGTFTSKERLFISGGAVADSRPDWQHLSFQFTTGASETGVRIAFVLYFGGNDETGSYFDVSECQLEQKPYPTSFVDGTRAAEDLTIPRSSVLPSLNAFTIAFRAYPNLTKIGLEYITGTNWARTGFLEIGNFYTANESNVMIWKNNPDGPNAIKVSVINNLIEIISPKITLTQAEWEEGPMIVLRYDGSRMYLDTFTPEGHQQVSVEASITHPVADLIRVGRAGAQYINGIIDELRIDNIARTDEEIAEWYNANEPLTPDEYTTYLSHFDGSLVSEKLPYACWESAPKDVSQASNKASGKAVITQTLNSGQVALYSASSPTSNGTYSDWALALPDGTLQHPPDNFVKTKLKLTDTDPYTVLLMHMDGSDNGTTFTDECGKTVTAHGDVCTKTAEKKFGTASAYFDGTGDYLSIPASEDFNFGAGDFTIDFWFRTSDVNIRQDICGQFKDNYNYWMVYYQGDGDGRIGFQAKSNNTTVTSFYTGAQTLSPDTFYHIVIERYGNVAKIFIDGVSQSITYDTSISDKTLPSIEAPLWIGRTGDVYTKGYIDEFRISKGVARWTSDFTPPTSQYVLNSRPVVHGLTVTFDGEPSATPILDDMFFGAEYMFTTLKDILIIANGQNAPYKWDGIGTPTLLGGNPPVLDFITTHNNRVWGVDAANKSRVRFSDILDPETWSVLNFIDFNPDDGDYITAMIRIGQDLVVSKQWSMALLTGNATTNYSVVWLDVEQGVTGKRALCNTNKYFTYVAQDGIRFTDFNSHAVASERLLPNWEKINKRRLNQAAMVYWRNYLLVALPKDNSLYNNTVWVYDMLRNAWSIINGWNVSNWLIFKQYGEEVLLAADSTTGQIYEVMRYSRYDDTEPVTYNIRTKDFTFDAPERYKLFRNINLDLEATAVESPLTVDLIVDGEKVGEYNTIIPANDRAKVHRMILPPLYNAVIGRSLSLALRGRCGIQGISLTYSFGGIVPDEEVVG